jgi:hypothetical protein
VAQWRRGPTQENERKSEMGPTGKLKGRLNLSPVPKPNSQLITEN